MTTVISAGRIYTTDGSEVTFDTNSPRLIWTDFKTGSVLRPQYRARTVNFSDTETENVTANVSLGSVSSFATDVFGMQRTVWSSVPTSDNSSQTAGTTGGEWINVNGSLIETMVGGQTNGQGITQGFTEISKPIWCRGILMVDYYISGGVLYLREQCKLTAYNAEANGYTFTTTLPSRTIHYRLLCGYYGA